MSGHGPSDSSRYDALLSILTSHLSARRLRPDAIPDECVARILEAGRWAMSGELSQPVRFFKRLLAELLSVVVGRALHAPAFLNKVLIEGRMEPRKRR